MASTKNILEVQDPETNSLITFELNEEDYHRATNDMHFVQMLLNKFMLLLFGNI